MSDTKEKLVVVTHPDSSWTIQTETNRFCVAQQYGEAGVDIAKEIVSLYNQHIQKSAIELVVSK